MWMPMVNTGDSAGMSPVDDALLARLLAHRAPYSPAQGGPTTTLRDILYIPSSLSLSLPLLSYNHSVMCLVSYARSISYPSVAVLYPSPRSHQIGRG